MAWQRSSSQQDNFQPLNICNLKITSIKFIFSIEARGHSLNLVNIFFVKDEQVVKEKKIDN